jgi:branched-chain amino acid transport system permease protein/neutral amino acid transport system permease protein
VVAAVSVVLDRLVYKRLRERDSGIVVFAMTSLGLAFATRAVVLMIWGPDPRNYVPGLFFKREYLFDVKLKTDEIFIMGAALAMAAAIWYLLYRTKLGKAMRAYSDNSNLAQVSGINTDRIVIWTWIVGGILMGTAGVLLSLQANLKPELGFQLLLPLFAATILGGIGKPQGAFIGGLVVGVAQETSGKFGQIWNHTFEPLLEVLTIGTWSPDMGIISAGYKPGIAFIVLIIILLLRPRGLFGSTSA